MEILPLFSSPLIIDRLDTNVGGLDREKNHVVNGKYQNSDEFRVLERHPRLERLISNKFKKVAKDVLGYNNEFKISTSWLTETKKGEESKIHNHRNCFYSGVYYYGDYPDDSGEIEFQSPVGELSDFYLIPNQWNMLNSEVWALMPQKNMIIFFPSYMCHKVCEHKDDTLRHSLAFNFIPIGEYGRQDSYYNSSW